MKRKLLKLLLLVVVLCPSSGKAQAPQSPLTSREIVALVYQLPKHPELRDNIVEEIRKRGIGFPLTDGLRSLVATKSGSDALLRRTLEEAERRRVNPTNSAVPPNAEAQDLLDRTRAATLGAAAAMPDFLVKQLISRSSAHGTTNNWIPQDNLTIAVGYRANAGEEYKVLAVNGVPLSQEARRTRDYSKDVPRGATSTGVEYISAVADVFKPESKTVFKVADTDMVQGRRTLVFEYQIEKPLSRLSLTASSGSADSPSSEATVGSRGRVWIDRETNRVLRFEQIATEIPGGFPITAMSSLIDYDWVTISENKYLLPTHSQILMTSVYGSESRQSRNEIRFRNYQKFGAELKVIDVVDEDVPDEP